MNLSSAFHANATLKTDKNMLVHRLDQLGFIKRVLDEPALRYEITNGNGSPESFIELGKDYIELRFIFGNQDYSAYNRNLASFVSFLTILDEFYEIRFIDLYSYIIDALNHNWRVSARDQDTKIMYLRDRIEVLGDSNFSLSRQITKLSKENFDLSTKLQKCMDFAREVICKAAMKNGVNGKKDHTVLARMGIDTELVEGVEEICS